MPVMAGWLRRRTDRELGSGSVTPLVFFSFLHDFLILHNKKESVFLASGTLPVRVVRNKTEESPVKLA